MLGERVRNVPRRSAEMLAEQVDLDVGRCESLKELIEVERRRLHDVGDFWVRREQIHRVRFERLLVVDKHMRRLRANVGRVLLAHRWKVDTNNDIMHINKYTLMFVLNITFIVCLFVCLL